MDDLVQFLRHRCDEEALEVVETADQFGSSWTVNEKMGGVTSDTGADVIDEPEAPYSFIARYDPDRAAAEVAAKRELLALHYRAQPRWCSVCDIPGDYEGRPYGCTTLRLLALPYADHPDYNEAWRP